MGLPWHSWRFRALEWSALLNQHVHVGVDGIRVEHFSPTGQPSGSPGAPSAYSGTKNFNFR
jgi:hypothetical protein